MKKRLAQVLVGSALVFGSTSSVSVFALEKSLMEFKPEFERSKECSDLKAPKKQNLFFDPSPAVLNDGRAMMYGDIKNVSKFKKGTLEKFKLIDKVFDNILDVNENDNLSYNLLFLSTQYYELKGVSPDHFGNDDDIFRDEEYRNTVYSELKMKLGEKGVDDHSYVIYRELSSLVGGHLVGATMHRKLEKEQLTENQRQACKNISSFGVPDRIALSTVRTPKEAFDEDYFDLNGREHSIFRGSTSITFYYGINEGKDTLVMTLQIGKFEMNWLKAKAAQGLYSLVGGLFSGGTKASISNTRLYFENKSK